VKPVGPTPEQEAERAYDAAVATATCKLRLAIREAWREYEKAIAQLRKERDAVMKDYYR
jgi:hypothetical protein